MKFVLVAMMIRPWKKSQHSNRSNGNPVGSTEVENN